MYRELLIHRYVNYSAILFLAVIMISCGSSGDNKANDKREKISLDTLRVGTVYGPSTYFIYRNEPMGYEYEMVKKYADSREIPVAVTVTSDFSELVSLLENGKIDLLIDRVPMTSEYRDKIRHCGPVDISKQVLVQKKKEYSGKNYVADVTDLKGKEVYVEPETKYSQRIENLNEELGGGIVIKYLSYDSLQLQNPIELVANGQIPFTVSEADIAEAEKTYYHYLDVSLPISLDQKSSWAVRKDNDRLANDIDSWSRLIGSDADVKALHKRYFEDPKGEIFAEEKQSENVEETNKAPMLNASSISKYDKLFRKYAPQLNWDWRLLAAIGAVESNFDDDATSWAGAEGVMQLMPNTAKEFGVSLNEIRNPDQNIAASVKLIEHIDEMFSKYVPDKTERIKFILAAYNAGEGHILDGIALAEKYGKNKQVWDGNVRDVLMRKSHPDHLDDPAMKHGYFHATETINFVDKVLSNYNYYKQHIAA